MACEKYAPTKKWHVDTVIKVLTLSEGYVREEYISQIITVVATNPSLYQYSIVRSYFAMKENLNQIGMVQLGVWLLGEFGEMLINGSAKDPDGNAILVDEEEITDLLSRILDSHEKKGDRSDTIICWVLTALSKLTIRLKTIQKKAKELIERFQDHMNVEIQQRACEYLQLFDKKWDEERQGIFEPIPIKGDLESKTVFETKDRPDFDENDQDDDSSIPIQASSSSKKEESKVTAGTSAQSQAPMIDLDSLLGGLGGSGSQQYQPTSSMNGGMIDSLLDVFG